MSKKAVISFINSIHMFALGEPNNEFKKENSEI